MEGERRVGRLRAVAQAVLLVLMGGALVLVAGVFVARFGVSDTDDTIQAAPIQVADAVQPGPAAGRPPTEYPTPTPATAETLPTDEQALSPSTVPTPPPPPGEPSTPPAEPLASVPADKEKPETAATRYEAGRHMFVAVDGATLSASSAEFLRRERPAGVILLGGNVRDKNQVTALVRQIKEAQGLGTGLADLPLIAVDQEGGSINRLRLKDAPSLRELGRRADPDEAREVGRRYAAACRERGIAIVFAPVLDVCAPGANSFLESRSFGGDAALVARLGNAFAEGLREGGVIPVAKHFPGHGATREDSHKGLAVIDQSGAELEATLFPFREAARAGIPAMMVGHLACPALDATGRPATMSERIIDGILRNEWQYPGLVITDDMGMGAIRKRYSLAESVVGALAAGNDMVLLCQTNPKELRQAFRAVEEAVRQGKLAKDRLEQSAQRFEALRKALRGWHPSAHGES